MRWLRQEVEGLRLAMNADQIVALAELSDGRTRMAFANGDLLVLPDGIDEVCDALEAGTLDIARGQWTPHDA